MKINIVTENFLGYRGVPIFGGAELLLYEEAKLLISRGHHVRVIQYGDHNATFNFEGIEVTQLKVPKLHFLARLGLTRRFHWGGFFWRGHIDKDVDRVHFHYYYLAYPCKRRWPWSTSGTSHGIDWDSPHYYADLSLRNLRDRFSFALMRHITKACVAHLDKIWSNDRFFMNYIMSEAPHLRDRLVHIPNFVDTSVFRPDVPSAKEVRVRFPGKRVILLPKMPSPLRGTDIALEALRLISDQDVALIVVGDSDYLESYAKMAENMGLASRVWFAGHMDGFRQMPSFYAAADIVILPSPSNEATAFAMLEGMAMRKPMVISNIGGLTEVAMDHVNSLVRKPNPKDFAEGISTLLNDPVLSEELANNAWQWVSKYYNKEIWDQRVIEFFEN